MMQDWEIDEYALIRVRKQRDRLLAAAKAVLAEYDPELMEPGMSISANRRHYNALFAAVKEVEE